MKRMKNIIEFLLSLRFDATVYGIQKNLLLAALIGVLFNLPKEVKSNFQQAVHIIVGTLLSTILTPMVMVLIEHLLSVKLPVESGYGIASLIGIIGVSSIKRIIIDKISSTKTKDEDDSDK